MKRTQSKTCSFDKLCAYIICTEKRKFITRSAIFAKFHSNCLKCDNPLINFGYL